MDGSANQEQTTLAAAADDVGPCPENGSERGPDGKFLPGNQVARQHGAFAKYQPPDLRLDAEALVEQIVGDLVGAEDGSDRSLELSALERTTVRHLGDVHVLMRLNLVEAIRQGVHTKAGGQAHDRFLAGVDRFLRLGAVVGWKRRARDLSALSLADYVRTTQPQSQGGRTDAD